MSKVKIQGNASGTGVLTVTAPNTSTDRTITLPDSSGTILDNTSTLDATKLSGDLPAISAASLTNVPKDVTVGGRKNILINGGFEIAQRGTTISGIGSAKYTLDRWNAISSGADSTVTQVSGATYPKALRLTGAGSTSGTYLQQKIESTNSRHLAGQTATFSVYLRASTAINIEFSIKYATSADNFGGTTSIASTTFNVTTTDTKFTWTGSIPSAATTGIQVQLNISSQGSAWYEASNAQLEVGSTATDFEHRSFGEELALCQRYYQKLSQNVLGMGRGDGSAGLHCSIPTPVDMRASPTMQSTVSVIAYSHTSASVVGSSGVTNPTRRDGGHITFTLANLSGMNDDRVGLFKVQGVPFDFDAEL